MLELGSILAIGMAAHWLAWRIRLPSIFFLLLAGFIAGPLLGFIHPDELLGDALFPIVSLSVAIILFEGGLSLDIKELKKIGRVVRNLVTIGALTTWVAATVLGLLLLDVSFGIAALLGAILIVTGPTVIIPMLRNIRPTANIANAVKWEGIVNDPTGAILAVLVFDVVVAGGVAGGIVAAASGVSKAVVFGGGFGLLGAGLIVVLLKRFLVPDFLQSPLTLAVVLAVFTLSDVLSKESGLLAVTVMGSALASQKMVSVRHIVEFKENLRVLLIAGLFVLLAARLPIDEPTYRDGGALLFMAALILVVRPLTIAVSTWRTDLTWRERVFLGFMAPRGIVAAAVASVFSIELVDAGIADGAKVAPVMFMVIVGTVALYGLTAGPVAKLLGVAKPNPQGVLILGASRLMREVAHTLSKHHVHVMLLDSNWRNVAAARQGGLKVQYGNALSEHAIEELDLDGIGYFVAGTPNDQTNLLATIHVGELFQRSRVFRLSPEEESETSDVPKHLQARVLFDVTATFADLQKRFDNDGKITSTDLTDDFTYEAFMGRHRDIARPLFVISPAGALTIIEAGQQLNPKPGATVVSLVSSPEAAS